METIISMTFDDNNHFFDQDDLIRMGIRKVGKNVRIHSSCIVVGIENISIGDNVRIDGFNSIIAAGGYLNLGSHIHIASHCYIGASAGVTMEDFSGLAYGIKIHSGSDDYSGEYLTNSTIPSKYKNCKSGPVHLGRHVIIGSNTVILPDVDIPIGCSVGALSMVTKNLDPWGVYCGCPVRRLKDRSQKLLEIEKTFLSDMEHMND